MIRRDGYTVFVFPTPVGMSPIIEMARVNTIGVPHTRGDEPSHLTR